jgi:DNA-binding transcriptional LysR family regulator
MRCPEILESLRRFVEWQIPLIPAICTAERRFRICMTYASHIRLLPKRGARVRAQAPGVRLEPAGIGGKTERGLESAEADLAIGYVPLGKRWHLINRHHPKVRAELRPKQYHAE